MASYGHYGQHTARIVPDHIYMPYPTSHIQFSSILPKKAPIILCNTRLNPIWMAWSGFGQKHLVRKQASVHDSLGLVLAECNQAAPHFLPSDSSAFFHRWPRSYCVKPAQIILCETSPDHTVWNQPRSYCVKPAQIILCETSPDQNILCETSPDHTV